MTDLLVYVYAVLNRPVPERINGIDHRPVRWVTIDDLAAAVSDVPAEDFDEEPLNANVRDLGWLGPRALAHQEVNSRLHDAADATVPLAFGSVFRDDERVHRLLTEQAPPLKRRLNLVRDASEWVVALHQLREPDAEMVAGASTAVQAARDEIAASAPGRAHLLRRRLAELERDEARRLQSEAAARVLEQLISVARDVFAEPLPDDAVERPLLRASVLVSRASESQFLDAMDVLRSRWPEPHYRLLLTGPWPAYRFGGLEREGRA